MQLKPQTTLQELSDEGLISIRTYNCLRNASLMTLKDIKDYAKSPIDLMKIKNFGIKSYEELQALYKDMHFDDDVSDMHVMLPSIDDGIVEILREAYDMLFREENRITQYIRTAYPSVERMHRMVMGDADNLLQICGSLSMLENIELRKMLAQYIYEVKTKMLCGQYADNEICIEYQTKYDILVSHLTDFTYRDKVGYFMSESKSKYIQGKYEQLRARSGERTRKFLEVFVPDYQQLAPLFDAPLTMYNSLYPKNCNKRIMTDIFDFNKLLRREFDICWSMNDDEFMIYILKKRYPFLSGSQRKFVVDYYREHGSFPLFYILYSYMRMSKLRNDKIFCLINGIYDGKIHSLGEVSEMMGITRERVRQITVGRFDLCSMELMRDEGWRNYVALFSLPFVTAESDEYKQINELEHLMVDFRVFSSLMQLVCICDLNVIADKKTRGNAGRGCSNQYEIDTINNMTVLIDRKRMPTFNASECVASLRKLVSTRYVNDTQIPISVVLGNLKCNNCGADDIRNFDERLETIKLVASIATAAFCLEVNDKYEVIFRKNYIDVSEELYSMLEQKGEPMSVEDMFKVFKKKYPAHKYTDSSQIRPYLYRHPNIKAIGNTSCYGLDSWKNVFYGSIKDLVLKLLEESDDPLHIEEIFKRVHEHYPNTYLESVYMSIKFDDFGRFVQFNDGRFGLNSKHYDESLELCSLQRQRSSFNDRITDFCDFVDTYKRYPMANNGDREYSLYHWLYNIQRGITVINDEQKATLHNILARHERDCIPRTGTEKQFIDRCEDYKAFIKAHNTLPTIATNAKLYNWMLRSKANYNTYIDHRRKYLTDLFNYLQSIGFCIK